MDELKKLYAANWLEFQEEKEKTELGKVLENFVKNGNIVNVLEENGHTKWNDVFTGFFRLKRQLSKEHPTETKEQLENKCFLLEVLLDSIQKEISAALGISFEGESLND